MSSMRLVVVSGLMWSIIQRYGTMLVSFVANLVMARLLTPDDYGYLGMLMIFIALANTFVDGGFGSAVIQKKVPSKEDYSTIFYWNIFISVVLYVILYAAAPAIASFYDMELLSDILRVQGIVLIINALGIVQNNKMRKEMKFKSLSIINIVAVVLSVLLAIGLAFYGFGVWSLVVQQLSFSFFNVALLWCFGGWKPIVVFSKKSFQELFGFGAFILSSNLINNFCNNIQGLLIGRFFTPATLGYYTQARKLEEVASTSMSSVIDQVSYPVFSDFQHDIVRLRGALRQLTVALAFCVVPCMLLLTLVAHPLIVFLYSAKWELCVPYFQVLCIGGIAVCLQNLNYYAVAAVGKSKKLFWGTVCKRLLALMCVMSGLLLGGLWGLLWGVVCGAYVIYLVNAWLVAKYLGYGLIAQLKDLGMIVLLAGVAYGLAVLVGQFLTSANSYVMLLCQVLVFVGVYLFGAQLLHMEGERLVKEGIKMLLTKLNFKIK